MKTQKKKDQPKLMDNKNAQVKEYQTPIFNEFGSVIDLTSGAGIGEFDGDFTGSNPT